MTQALVVAVVVLGAVALLTAMSLRANRRFERRSRLPMQWGLDGSINWTAPRKVALAFTPVLAAICLMLVGVAAAFVKPRAGQEDLVIPVVIFCAAAFVVAHALHLWLIRRALQRQP
jgi:hypothetical protein